MPRSDAFALYGSSNLFMPSGHSFRLYTSYVMAFSGDNVCMLLN